MTTKVLFLGCIFTALLSGCSDNDKLEASESELVNRISGLEKTRQEKMDSLVQLCSGSNIIQYKGTVSPTKLAEEIRITQEQADEYRTILSRSVITTKVYKRKPERRR